MLISAPIIKAIAGAISSIFVFIVVQGFYNLVKKIKQEGGHHQMNLQ